MQRRGPIELDEDKKKAPNSSKNDSSMIPNLSDEDLSNQPSNLVFGYLNLFSDGVVSLFAKAVPISNK